MAGREYVRILTAQSQLVKLLVDFHLDKASAIFAIAQFRGAVEAACDGSMSPFSVEK